MNFLDRAISFVSPGRGLDRALARANIERVRAAYEAASVGRRTAGWRASNASANVATRGALHMVRARSRDIVRNTWWGPRIVTVTASHAVGSGITPVCKDSPAAVALWKEWGKACDAEGQLNIDGLTALAVRTVVESGETLARFIPTARIPGRVPLEVQLLEPDHLDPSRDRVMFQAGRDMTIVDQGIEYAPNGKRVNYWLFPENPSAVGLVARMVSTKVAASEIIHLYRKDRIGQGRGVPWVAPVVLKGRDLADIEDAVSMKAKVEACFAVYRKRNDPATNLAQATRTEPRADGTERNVESVAPGTITDLFQGEEISAVQPSASLGFDAVIRGIWMTIAAGSGLTYDQLTGDLTQANYSSLRAGKIEFRAIISQFQWLNIVPMFLQPIWDRFIQTAVDAGELPYRRHGYQVEWLMPAWEPIDPLKDLQADILAVRSGRMTWDQFVAAWGFDPEAQLQAISAWQKRLDKDGIVLDSDPRRQITGIKGVPKSNSDQPLPPVDPDNPQGTENDNAS